MQNPESNTAAERPSLLTVKAVRYFGSLSIDEARALGTALLHAVEALS